MPEVHAKLSASGAKKWLNCPGSISLESTMSEKESIYAVEGTNAHALGEAKIRFALKELTRAKFHKAIKSLDITDENMEEYTDSYRDFVIERYNAAKSKTPDAKIFLEQRLDFSKWVPEGFGTADALIISDGVLEIIDLKYGQGVSVSPKNNPQFMLYALGAIEAFEFLYDIDSVVMTVYQPRIDNIDSWAATTEDLKTWAETEVIPMAQKAFNEVQEFNCGKHCDEGFCKARPICRVYAENKLQLARLEFKTPPNLSNDEIGEVLEQAESLASWAKCVKEYALQRAINDGINFPGWKLVEGRSNRTWSVDESYVTARLIGKGCREDDISPRKLLGVTGLEKLLGKKTFNDLLSDFVIKPPGSPTLVPFTDKRPELNSSNNAVEDFKNVIEK